MPLENYARTNSVMLAPCYFDAAILEAVRSSARPELPSASAWMGGLFPVTTKLDSTPRNDAFLSLTPRINYSAGSRCGWVAGGASDKAIFFNDSRTSYIILSISDCGLVSMWCARRQIDSVVPEKLPVPLG